MPVLFFHGSAATVFLVSEEANLRDRIGSIDDVPPLSALTDLTAAAIRADETFALSLRAPLAVQLVGRWMQNDGLVVDSGNASVGKLIFSDPRLTFGNQALSLGVSAQTEAGDKYSAVANFSGSDLSFQDASLQMIGECAEGDIACQLRATLAPVAAAALTATYRGAGIHTLMHTEIVKVRSGQLACDIIPIVTRLRARAGELEVIGRLMFERPSE
jgi:hypothetical protein